MAPQAVEVGEARLLFPGGIMLPMSVRGRGLPGMPERPWARLKAGDFLVGAPLVYSLSLRREAPDLLKGSLRARRTLFEGLLLALAEKTGRRPSLAEQAADAALDAAESAVTLGQARLPGGAGGRALRQPGARRGGRDRPADAGNGPAGAAALSPSASTTSPSGPCNISSPAASSSPGLDEPVLLLEEALPLDSQARPAGPAARPGRAARHPPAGRAGRVLFL